MASCRASAGGTVPGCGLRWGRYLSLAEQRPEWDEDGVTTNISGGDFKFGGFCFGSDFLLLCSVVLQFLYFCSMLDFYARQFLYFLLLLCLLLVWISDLLAMDDESGIMECWLRI